MADITLGGNPVHTNGDLPAQGQPAPGFTLTKSDMTPLTLDDLAGQNVLLNIFPSVDTGVCAQSVRTFNERAADLENTTVVCASADLPFAQARFCGAEGIEGVQMGSAFRNPEFLTDYGVQMTDGGFAGLAARAVVVINPDGNVAYTELVPEVGQEPDYDAALGAL
ncbi:thiol peroxidase [Euzebya tangerina]|uniref:thiol peroxidase n=1 Tax=Euzebya tangerina TaxID=591198 RepID=UPI000E31DAD8|nr:thiol peroxidase [Euzebya tangerina]